MDDLEIVRRLKSGDDGVFPIVLEKYQRLVLNCSFKFLRNRESAEDITQEVFVEVFESIQSFRGESRLSTWIYRIAVTKCLNHLKRLKTKKRFAMLVSLFEKEGGIERLPSPESMSPDRNLENQERARVLAMALEQLPTNQRIAFTLSTHDEFSYEEISSIMNTSISSVESLIHRARTRLKKILSGYYREHS